MKKLKIMSVLGILVFLLILVGCSNITTTTNTANTSITDTSTTSTTTEISTVVTTDKPEPSPIFKRSESSFVMAVLPDTQVYTNSNTQAQIFYSQMNWIVNNSESHNIKFTSHLGDIVDRAYNVQMWKIADQAFKILDDAIIPYGVTSGNHDFRGLSPDTSFYLYRDNQRATSEFYLQYMNKERTSQATENYGGHSENGWNSYYYFEGNGKKYMVLFVDFAPSDETVTWANQILDANQNIPTILITHKLSQPTSEGTGSKISCTECVDFWTRIIYENNQVFMAINGHHAGAGYELKKNKYGNDVICIIVDYQAEFRGGNGMMRLMEFDEVNNKIYSTSFSPYVLTISKENRTISDKLELFDSKNKFMINWNFAERFSFRDSVN